jgi:hypothetical protein
MANDVENDGLAIALDGAVCHRCWTMWAIASEPMSRTAIQATNQPPA